MPQASKTRPLGFQFDFVDHVPLQPVMKKKLPREVMCGLLIRRASRYYAWSPRVLLFFSFAASSCHTAQVVNIMLMLGLISSVAFAIYTVACLHQCGKCANLIAMLPMLRHGASPVSMWQP